MYLNTWKQLASMSFSSTVSSRLNSATYFIGKIVRFGFFLLFILSLFSHVDTIAGYTSYQVLLFYLTFNFVDIGSQFFFRGFYVLRNEVKKGNFDMTLVKPISPLFLVFSRIIDFLDLLFVLPIVGLIMWVLPKAATITLPYILWYLFFLLLSSLIVLSLHVLSAAATVYTTESDNVIWVYRATMGIGSFPPNILPATIQWFFMYIFPIIIVVSYPVQALLGKLTMAHILISCIITVVFLLLSNILWKKSLRHYSSASS